MKELTLKQAQVMTSPNPFALILSSKPVGGTNLMAASWWTYVSNNPPMIAVSLSKKGYTGECIAASGTFALCVPDSSLAEAAFYCGTASGRTVDKAAGSGIALTEMQEGFPPVVENSQLVLLCRLEQAVPAGDHTLHIASVEAVYGDESRQGLKSYEGYRYVK